MTDTIATIFGMGFVSIILICLVWTILGYIFEAFKNENNLERNMKEYDNKKNNYEQSR
jgi:hypothetical protein